MSSRNRFPFALAIGALAAFLAVACNGSGGARASNPGAGESCGHTECGAGQFCCNRSCSICAPTGGSCTQQQCTDTQG